jgi:ankyrin repeat protein
MKAAGEGVADVVRVLLSLGADTDACSAPQEQDRWSALGIASYGGHEKTVRILLDHAADPNLRLFSSVCAVLTCRAQVSTCVG